MPSLSTGIRPTVAAAALLAYAAISTAASPSLSLAFAFVRPDSFSTSSQRQRCRLQAKVRLQPKVRLLSQVDGDQSMSDTIERWELHDQFERWRFMQRLLEGEIPPSDVEDVLVAVLRAYLLHGPTVDSGSNGGDRDEDNGGSASPVLTDERRRDVEVLLRDVTSTGRFLHGLVLPPVDYKTTAIDVDEATAAARREINRVEVDPSSLSMLMGIESMLPDPDEDEEAHVSAWDVVIELYGRESVRVKEEKLQREREEGGTTCDAENLQWRTLAAAARVLIHYDFLTKGVLKEGAFR